MIFGDTNTPQLAQPATVAAVARTDEGPPVGLQIIAAYGHCLTIIAFARHVAAATGGFKATPGFG